MAYTFGSYFVDGWIMPEMPLAMFRDPVRYPANVDAVIVGHTSKVRLLFTVTFYANLAHSLTRSP